MILRRLLLFVVFAGLTVPVVPVSAQPDSLQAAFQTGNEAYRQGRYAEAVDAYRSILESGRAGAQVYYNLGNAYYRTGEIGRSIQFYEKAQTLRPDDRRIRHNLERARDEVPAARAGNASPGDQLRSLVRTTLAPLPLFVFALLLLSAAGAVALTRDRPDDPGWTHPLTVGLAAGGLCLALAAFGTSYLEATASRAVVITERVPLRSAPSGTSAPDTTLPEGVLLHILPRPRDTDTSATEIWTYVRLTDGRRGWLPASALGRVD